EWRGVPSLMDRIFDDTFSRFFEDTETSFTGELWSPAVDVSETNKDIVFTAEFPGFEKNEIDITVDDGHLIISGERKFSDRERRNDIGLSVGMGNSIVASCCRSR
ncbi:Hsp20/alpha crystallin family protein, partial [Acidobacteria bacterium AH-259-G07]|nr:Hsp20/alpha crystallin family protein [Acidobacteria bacterium AH-259-G07]